MTEQVFFEKAIIKAGWELGLITPEKLNDNNLTAFQRYIATEAFSKNRGPLYADAIYFSGEYPFIYFKKLASADEELTKNLHHKIWNEGRLPFLVTITPTEIRVYDCYKPPVEKNKDLGELEIAGPFQSKIVEDLDKLADILGQAQIDSGKIWLEGGIGNQLTTDNKVDKLLLSNFISTRRKLLGYGIPIEVIHNLLGRSLFILYLEDNGVLSPENYPKKPTSNIASYFDLLEYPQASNALFEYLNRKFNGDLFPVSEMEEQLDENAFRYALTEIRSCFYGNNQTTGQLALWKLFAFEYIPLELISSIYEEFMSGNTENAESIKSAGAFYTPKMLVEFVLNEVLPWPDSHNTRYDLKILDPACGSGIFLVEAYRRLIERYCYKHGRRKLTVEKLQEILLNCIYGIESNPEAIKVAAFSLYLVFLHYLNPKDIWTDWKFEPLVRWTKPEEVEERKRKRKKLGNNLFQCDTFSENDFKNVNYDLVIGNPPWLRSPSGKIKEYIDKQGKNFPKEAAVAFMDYIPKLAPNALIGIVCNLKLLFNTGKNHEEFRRKLFTDNTVEGIINLGILRDIVFKSAKSPAAVIIYKPGKPSIDKETIIYCVPKNVETIKGRQSIVIDSTEVKYLPIREIIKEGAKIFKIAMWGGMRDLALIKSLNRFAPLTTVIKKDERGGGLIHDKDAKHKGNPHLADHTFLLTDDIKPYYTRKGKLKLKKVEEESGLYRTNNCPIFNPPLILIKEGTYEDSLCSTYIDFPCAYQMSSVGISLKDRNANFHKALVACFNSTLANYYFFLTSSNWETAKGGQIQKNELLEFPSIVYQFSDNAINELASEMDNIKSWYASNESDHELKKSKDKIDKIIYDEIDFSDTDRKLIAEVLNYSSGLSTRYSESGATKKTTIEKDIKPYAKHLANGITNTLRYSKKGAWVEIFPVSKEPLNIIAIHFDDLKTVQAKSIEISDVDITRQIKKINKFIYEQHSESIYYRKSVRFYTQKTIYIIKPNEKRFWGISQALNDTDAVLAELINSAK